MTANKKSCKKNKAIQQNVQETMKLLHNDGAEVGSECGGGSS